MKLSICQCKNEAAMIINDTHKYQCNIDAIKLQGKYIYLDERENL